MRWLSLSMLAASVATGCGRISFDVGSDSQVAIDGTSTTADAVPLVPNHVTTSAMSTGVGANFADLTVPIPTPAVGSLLVVMIASHGAVVVTGVEDGSSTTFVSANARAVASNTASEIWYGFVTDPRTSVSVHLATATHFDVWVSEVVNVKPAAPEAVAMNCLQYPPDLAKATITTTVPNQLVAAVTMCAAPLYVDQASPPFTGLGQQNGNNAAAYIAPMPGSYDADYAIVGGNGMNAMTCESTATWLPGP